MIGEGTPIPWLNVVLAIVTVLGNGVLILGLLRLRPERRNLDAHTSQIWSESSASLVESAMGIVKPLEERLATTEAEMLRQRVVHQTESAAKDERIQALDLKLTAAARRIRRLERDLHEARELSTEMKENFEAQIRRIIVEHEDKISALERQLEEARRGGGES